MMDGCGLAGRYGGGDGGAGAIGSAICADLAALGARVMVADMDEAGAAKVRGRRCREAVPMAAWTSPSPPRWRSSAARRAVDIVVHNAGVSIVEPFTSSDPAAGT